MDKYCVFLFNSKTNKFGEVLLKDATKDEAIKQRNDLKQTGLPAFYENEEVMKSKYKLVL